MSNVPQLWCRAPFRIDDFIDLWICEILSAGNVTKFGVGSALSASESMMFQWRLLTMTAISVEDWTLILVIRITGMICIRFESWSMSGWFLPVAFEFETKRSSLIESKRRHIWEVVQELMSSFEMSNSPNEMSNFEGLVFWVLFRIDAENYGAPNWECLRIENRLR